MSIIKTSAPPKIVSLVNRGLAAVWGWLAGLAGRWRQAEFHQNEAQLRLALDAAGLGLWEWNILTGVITCSKQMNHIFGLAETQFAGTYTAYLNLIHLDDRQAVEQAISGVLIVGGNEYQIEHRIIRPDGAIRWLESKGHVYRNAVGQPIYLMGIVMDITGRKQAEEALRESEERYRLISEVAVNMAYVYQVDDQGNFVSQWAMEKATEAVTGFKLEEIGAVGGWLALVYEDDKPLMLQHRRRLLANQASRVEYRLVTKTGQIRWLHDFAYPIWNETEQRVSRVYGGGRDISERKQTEVTQTRLLDETQRRVKELTGLHEIAQAFGTLTDVRETFGVLAERLAHLVGAQMCIVSLLDPTGGEMQAQAPGYGVNDPILKTFRYPAPAAREIWNLRKQGPFLANSPDQIPAYFYEALKAADLKSVLVAPMWVKGRIVGQVTVCNKPGGFNQDDARLLQVFANQAAVVIQNARLYSQTEHQFKRLQILHQIDQAILAAQSPQRIAQTALQQIRHLISYQRASIILFDFEANRAAMFVIDPDRNTLSDKAEYIPLDAIPDMQKLAQGQDIILEDIETLSQEAPFQEQRLIEEGAPSYINLPLMFQGKLIGLLNLATIAPRPWDAQQLEVAREVANQLAIAIRQAHLQEQIEHYTQELERRVADRTRELSALYEVTALASESLDLRIMLERSLEQVLAAMRGQAGTTHLLDEARTALYLVVQQGLPSELAAYYVEPLPLNGDLPGWIIEHGEPLIIADLTADPRIVRIPRDHLQAYAAYAGVPVRARGQVLGSLSIIREKGQPQFNLEEVALLTSIADHIGVVVESARLRQRAEQTAVVEERARLARDLHDSVTQLLYSLNLFVTAGREAYRLGDLVQVNNCLSELGDIAQQALNEMRLLVYELRPPALEHDGLIGALQQRLDVVEKRTGVKTDLVAGELPELPGPIEAALYYIAREALNNVLKHARATIVTIRIKTEAHHLELEVTDNGSGFDLEAIRDRAGLGLASMHERAEKLGGVLTLHSRPGEGTKVMVRVAF